MSTPNPALIAAAPSLISILQAIQTFKTNLGPDLAKWPVTASGAETVLLGTIELQLAALGVAEIGAGESVLDAKVSGWITNLQTLVKAAPTGPVVTSSVTT